MRRIALIAGRGRLPLIFADEAKRCGAWVIGIAIKGITPPELQSHVDKIYWADIADTKKALEILRVEKVSNIAMTGKIPKGLIFSKRLKIDENASRVLKDTVDSRDYTIIKAVAAGFKKEGISVMDPTVYLSALLAKKGLLTRRAPTKEEWEDIRFGWKAAKKVAGMDIGQTVVVKKKMILAVEAIEGTDKAIERAGQLKVENAVIVKVSRPHQDMRFDIPAIGPETIDSLIEARAAVLAVEARKTLVVDKDEVVKKADAAGISVVAV